MQKGFAPIYLLIGILILAALGGGFYFLSRSQIKSSTSQPQTSFPTPQPTKADETANWKTPSPTTLIKVSEEGLIYRDPCKTGDENGCIMQKAYAKIHKLSNKEDYSIIWDEAFRVCESYPNDLSILFDQEQCKMDVCTNLALGDGNLKYKYSAIETCRKEVLPICKDGSIIENIPCACDIPAGAFAAYSKYWLEAYWNKYRENDPPFYCCSGEQQDNPCNNLD